MAWDPGTYLRFADQRTRPAAELLSRVALPAIRLAVDLGCGPGNSTRLLGTRWPDARLMGVDSSAAMLAQARESGLAAEWVQADVAGYDPPAGADLIFSNALFQWLPDHPAILSRLAGRLGANGVLAVQMPSNFDAPSHILLHETALARPWADRVRDLVRDAPVRTPAFYYDLLDRPGLSLDVWTTEYFQVLTGPDSVLAWMGGTALTPFLDRLDGPERDGFVGAYAARLRAAYPERPDGTTLFPFRRLFIVAQRS